MKNRLKPRTWKILFIIGLYVIVVFAQTPNTQGDPAINPLITIIQTTYMPGNRAPTIGEFSAPLTVYADKYFLLNATIKDSDGVAQFLNATVELSNGIILKWENSTNTFSAHQDNGNYYILDSIGSFKTNLNSTAHRLSWKVKLAWMYPEGYVNVLSANTKVFDSGGLSGSGSYANLFYFEKHLIVATASVDDSKVNPSQTVTFTGTLYYEGTTNSPGMGNSALSFDGVDDYLETTKGAYENGKNFTFESWIYFKSFPQMWNPIFGQHNFPRLEYNSVEKKLYMQHYLNGADTSFISSVVEPLGVWTHFVVISYKVDNVDFYINGAFLNRATHTGTITHSDPAVNPITLATPAYPSTIWADVIIDEVRVYNRALNSTEISEHYQGIYSNETGLVLHLDYDNDTYDKSAQENHATNNGALWTSGYINGISIKLKSPTTLKKSKPYLYSSTGSFSLSIIAESTIGQHSYTIFATTPAGNTVQNQTVNVIVDRLKIVEGGATPSSVYLGETQTIWFKALYEFDNSEFDGAKGTLYVNGSAMEWSINNKRWEYKFTAETPGSRTFKITAVSDTRYNLTFINDIAGVQTITVGTRWYDPVVEWLIGLHPLIWVGISALIILAALFRLGIIEVEIEKPTEPAQE